MKQLISLKYSDSSIPSIRYYSTKLVNNKLPNVAVLARQLTNTSLNNIKFDIESNNWYILSNGIFIKILKTEALQKVWNVLEKDPTIVNLLTPEYTKKVLKSMILCSGIKIKPFYINVDNKDDSLYYWIISNISYVPLKSSILVGNKYSDPNKTLFMNYLKYCNINGYTPLSIIYFSNSLIKQLNIVFHSHGVTFYKKRTAYGIEINNIKIK